MRIKQKSSKKECKWTKKRFLMYLASFLSRATDPQITKSNEKISMFLLDEIKKAMETFKAKRSSGPDGIPMLIVKAFSCEPPYPPTLLQS